MDNYSSISNEDRNNIRSDPLRMNNIDQIRLARLRPEKLDDASVKQQISLIQQACGNVDPEIIALVFHECDYHIQNTINRIRTGDFQVDEWQTAKSNNKKKIHNNNQTEQISNGGILSDSERSLSQRTSPTASLRDERRRNDYYQYSSSIRNDNRRYGNNPGRNQFNPRYSTRKNVINKSIPSIQTNVISSEPIPNETSLPSKQANEEISQIISPSIDEYEFVDGPRQSLSFDNSQKQNLLPSSSKRRLPSTIPQQPVSMHPTVQFSTEPIDIQFGDVQWNDSIPIAISPSDNAVLSTTTTLDDQQQDMPAVVNTHNHRINQDVQDTLSSNYINHHSTNETDNQLLETTNQLSSSLSITDNTISNNLSIVSPEGTSHLSDHLTEIPLSIPTEYSSEQPVPIQIPITRLPPTPTTHIPEYTSPTSSQFMPNNTTTTTTSSAFTPFNTLGNYTSIPREYSQTTNWNPQSSNYKTSSKTTMIPTGNYPQQQQQPSYQLPHQQQQQIILGTYPYPTLSPTLVQVFAPLEHWPPTGYSTPIDSYPYPTANYIPTYSNQQQYHPQTKYDQHYDKEFFTHYGQTRSSNNDISYQQQQPITPSQSTKDIHTTSKLSPTAATFSQGAPITTSPSATTLYLNPVAFPMPNYYPSISGTTHHDRTLSYSSIDNRDNRNGANNRTNYYHYGQQQQQQPQQRTHNTNISNSTWHLQQ